MTSSPQATLRIGSRGSPLALAQANEAKRRLLATHPELGAAGVEIVVIKTTGDRIQDRSLAAAGGKGLFTKELEEALLAGTVDVAVHSMKDVPTVLPTGLGIVCLLPREDPRDVLIAGDATSLAGLKPGAVVGTASLRRQAQVLHRRPDVKVVTLRGNVHTRLRRLQDGSVDATFLALAGLNRLGLAAHASAILEPEEMLPAVAQGAIGLEARLDDRRTANLLAPLHDLPTAHCVAAERAMLAVLDGSCRTPIAGLAQIAADGRLTLRAAVLRPDGSEMLETTRIGPAADAQALGGDAGGELRRRGGSGFFTAG